MSVDVPVDVPVFRLGPLGGMVPLAIPETGMSRTPTKLGTIHASINGTRTHDVRAVRRTWSISMAYVEPDDVSLLEAMYLGAVAAPLRLLDPTSRNRLSASTSTGHATTTLPGAAGNWHTPHGGITTEWGDTPPVRFPNDYQGSTTYPAGSRLRWDARGTSGSAELLAEVDRDRASPLERAVPVFPGEDIVASAHMRHAPGESGALALTVRFVDTTGATVAETTPATVESGEWARVATTATVPEAATAAVLVFTTHGGGLFDITHAQMEPGSEPTRWVVGAGCPAVLFTELAETSPRWPLVTTEITLEER